MKGLQKNNYIYKGRFLSHIKSQLISKYCDVQSYYRNYIKTLQHSTKIIFICTILYQASYLFLLVTNLSHQIHPILNYIYDISIAILIGIVVFFLTAHIPKTNNEIETYQKILDEYLKIDLKFSCVIRTFFLDIMEDGDDIRCNIPSPMQEKELLNKWQTGINRNNYFIKTVKSLYPQICHNLNTISNLTKHGTTAFSTVEEIEYMYMQIEKGGEKEYGFGFTLKRFIHSYYYIKTAMQHYKTKYLTPTDYYNIYNFRKWEKKKLHRDNGVFKY